MNYCNGFIEKVESYLASVTFLSESSVTHNNDFTSIMTLLKTELELEEQKLRT
jgi:hypothetical protein